MSRAIVVCAALLCAVAARADDAQPLSRNPFVRPRLVELATPAESAAAAPLEIRAVLSAGDASLADVGGRIVRVGEEVDGYTLVAVTEGGARFVKDGRTFEAPLQARAAPPVTDAPQAVAEESGDAD